ncbi:MAG: bifunctional YncE family protein/alkaline phosphatase family protein [Actinomycetota bacterium]
MFFSLLVVLVVAGAQFGWTAYGPSAGAEIIQLSTLPTGVEIHPVGQKVGGVGPGQLPVSVALSPDGRTAVTADSGPAKSLTVFDVATRQTSQRIDLQPAGQALYNGLVWVNGGRFIAAGGPSGQVYVYDRGPEGFTQTAKWRAGRYVAALALVGSDLLAVDQDLGVVTILNAANGAPRGVALVGDHPEDVVASSDGTKIWVSNWGAKTVSVILHPAPGVYLPAGAEANRAGSIGDVRDYLPSGVKVGTVIDVGDHPSDLLLAPDGKSLYVTNGNDDTVSVIDTATDTVRATIDVAPYPNAPKSTAPQGLAITPDGATLFVANGGNNNVAVVDTATAKVRGLIPAGWYPSAVALAGDDLVIVNAKGDGPLIGYSAECDCYSGGADPKGTIYILELAQITPAALAAWTTDVTHYNRFDTRPGDIDAPAGNGINNVKKIVYVVRENKTFDQEFGDIAGADARPDLVRYGREITPNSHAMAETWALLDNFQVNTETSIIGHQFSNAGQLSDYTQRTFGNTLLWTGSSAGRIPDEGIQEVSFPNSGYLVDNVIRHGKSARIYGFEGGRASVGKDAVLKDVNNIDFAFPPGFDNGAIPDTIRVREFLRDVQVRGLADFTYIWLPADHTVGGLPGGYGPNEQVASNDVATGMVLEWLSHSKYWNESAMFVVEDDPQSGKDHVSPYRSIFMAASPWLKRGYHSSEHYTVPGLLRTMELALGLPAMSQNEHSATPMLDIFTTEPDFTPYDLLTADIPPAFNPPIGPYAERSLKLNFAIVDQDEGEIAELLEDMLVRDPVKTIPIDDRFGATAAEKWRSLSEYQGPMTDLVPAAAAPSAEMKARIADAMEVHRTEPAEAEDESIELAEWVAEQREERLELAAGRAVVGGIAAALVLGVAWLWFGVKRKSGPPAARRAGEAA